MKKLQNKQKHKKHKVKHGATRADNVVDAEFEEVKDDDEKDK